jgi:hypothetical protein
MVSNYKTINYGKTGIRTIMPMERFDNVMNSAGSSFFSIASYFCTDVIPFFLSNFRTIGNIETQFGGKVSYAYTLLNEFSYCIFKIQDNTILNSWDRELFLKLRNSFKFYCRFWRRWYNCTKLPSRRIWNYTVAIDSVSRKFHIFFSKYHDFAIMSIGEPWASSIPYMIGNGSASEPYKILYTKSGMPWHSTNLRPQFKECRYCRDVIDYLIILRERNYKFIELAKIASKIRSESKIYKKSSMTLKAYQMFFFMCRNSRFRIELRRRKLKRRFRNFFEFANNMLSAQLNYMLFLQVKRPTRRIFRVRKTPFIPPKPIPEIPDDWSPFRSVIYEDDYYPKF